MQLVAMADRRAAKLRSRQLVNLPLQLSLQASKQQSRLASSHKTAAVYGATRTLKFCTAEPSGLTANSRGKTPTRFLRRDPPPDVICRQQRHAALALVMVYLTKEGIMREKQNLT